METLGNFFLRKGDFPSAFTHDFKSEKGKNSKIILKFHPKINCRTCVQGIILLLWPINGYILYTIKNLSKRCHSLVMETTKSGKKSD